MNISNSTTKCISKIDHIETTEDITSLAENYRKYTSVSKKQKRDPSIQNPYSKDQFNIYKNYLRLKRKVKSYYDAQKHSNPSSNNRIPSTTNATIAVTPESDNVHETPPTNTTTVVTPDTAIAATSESECNSKDCNCLG